MGQLIEPGGQLRFDFAAVEAATARTRVARTWQRSCRFPPRAGPVAAARHTGGDVPLASNLDEQGQLEAAAELYRAVLVAAGPRAEVNFLLAELLYRMGDLPAARERYYTAIELDEDYVEARANLGCVLAEMGQYELAVAAFEGALAYHDDYPDVHYHLARTLDGWAAATKRNSTGMPSWTSSPIALGASRPADRLSRGARARHGLGATADPGP